jgi:hypothetical protein
MDPLFQRPIIAQKPPQMTRWGAVNIGIVLLLIASLFVVPTTIANNDAFSNSGKKGISQRNAPGEYTKEDSYQAEANRFNFRKTAWGMSPAEVKASESAEFQGYSKKDKMMFFSGQVASMPALIGYIFADDKLNSGAYVFEGKHTNSNKYLDDFTKLEEMLVQKYGNPQKDKTTWSSDLFKDNPQHWGMAVSMGYLSHSILWETASTTILLSLSGDNFKVTLQIFYLPKGQLDILQQMSRKTNASDF